MAQKVSVELVDDMDGSAADETVSFGLDGSQYEVDLSTAGANNLRDAVMPYIAVARQAGKKASAPRVAAVAPSGSSAKAIREWAIAQGMTVPARGRLPKEVVDAFAAQPKQEG